LRETLRGVLGEERLANRVVPREWKLFPFFRENTLVKFVRDLKKDAGAVTGIGIGSGGASVSQPFQNFEPSFHHIVAGAVPQFGDKAEPARIVLVTRTVQSLGVGERHSFLHTVI